MILTFLGRLHFQRSFPLICLFSSFYTMENTTTLADAFVEGDAACTVLNTSCECHYEYQFYEFTERLILGLVALPIVVFGLCANLTSVRIFTHRLMSSSSINW